MHSKLQYIAFEEESVAVEEHKNLFLDLSTIVLNVLIWNILNTKCRMGMWLP